MKPQSTIILERDAQPDYWVEKNPLTGNTPEVVSLVFTDFLDVDCVWSLRAFTNFELDGVPVSDGSINLRCVYEEVISAFDLNESVSSCLVEPLDRTLCHVLAALTIVLEPN